MKPYVPRCLSLSQLPQLVSPPPLIGSAIEISAITRKIKSAYKMTLFFTSERGKINGDTGLCGT